MAWAGCDNQAAAVRPGERQTALGLGWEEARDWEQGWTWEVTEIPHSILIPVRGRGHRRLECVPGRHSPELEAGVEQMAPAEMVVWLPPPQEHVLIVRQRSPA